MTQIAVESIHKIEQMPIPQRMFIVEHIIHSIREESQSAELETAAEYLYDDYKNDQDLTALTCLDCENFYEAR